MRRSKGEKIFGIANNAFLVLFSFIMIIPVWHVAMYSLSNANSVYGGGLFISPRNFSINAYRIVLNSSLVKASFANTVFVVVIATMLNLIMTLLASYPLSKKHLRGRRFISYYIYFTMLFAGGLIPSYLVVKSLVDRSLISFTFSPLSYTMDTYLIGGCIHEKKRNCRPVGRGKVRLAEDSKHPDRRGQTRSACKDPAIGC